MSNNSPEVGKATRAKILIIQVSVKKKEKNKVPSPLYKFTKNLEV